MNRDEVLIKIQDILDELFDSTQQMVWWATENKLLEYKTPWEFLAEDDNNSYVLLELLRKQLAKTW